MSVSYNYDAFIQQFPQFAPLSDSYVNIWWTAANGWFDNNGWPGQLTIAATAMNLLTAHLLTLFSAKDASGAFIMPGTPGAQPASGLVGRINTATEGSVSVGAEWGSGGLPASPEEAWFIQTPYGAAFWTLIAPYRTAVYIAEPTFIPGTGPWPFLPPWRHW